MFVLRAAEPRTFPYLHKEIASASLIHRDLLSRFSALIPAPLSATRRRMYHRRTEATLPLQKTRTPGFSHSGGCTMAEHSEAARAAIRPVKEQIEDDLISRPGVVGVDIGEKLTKGTA